MEEQCRFKRLKIKKIVYDKGFHKEKEKTNHNLIITWKELLRINKEKKSPLRKMALAI